MRIGHRKVGAVCRDGISTRSERSSVLDGGLSSLPGESVSAAGTKPAYQRYSSTIVSRARKNSSYLARGLGDLCQRLCGSLKSAVCFAAIVIARCMSILIGIGSNKVFGAQSLVTCVIVTLLVGCGSGGKPAMAADYVPVHLYYVAHEQGLTACQVAEAWAYAQEAFDRAKVPVVAASMTEVSDFGYSNFDDPRYQYNRLDAARAWLRKHEINTAWSVHYFFLPPLICTGGMKCYGGMAERVCKPDGGVSIGQSGDWSSHNPPRDRIYASGLIAAHEIGHLLGAYHTSGADVGDSRNFPPNIMDLAAGRFVDTHPGNLWFLPESSAEMMGCVPFAKKRAIKLCRQNFKRKPVKRRKCVQRTKRRAPVLRSSGVVDQGFVFQ